MPVGVPDFASDARRNWVEVDLAAIAENVRALRSRRAFAKVEVCAVVKDDAYGHGAVPVARAALAGGADRLGVADAAEGAALRKAGIDARLLVLSPVPPAAAEAVVAHDLACHVATKETAEALSSAARAAGKKVRVHVKVDTGMHRSGVAPGEAAAFLENLRGLDGIEVEGIFSHFAEADAADRTNAYDAFDRFVGLLRDLTARGLCPPVRHIANSAAAIDMPETALEMIRPGIAIYGIYPSPFVGDAVRIRPALSFRARLVELRTIERGEAVGYGATWRAERATRIGLVSAGYGDGYPRLLSNRAEVVHRGRRRKIAGRVSMDLLSIDLGPEDDGPAEVGDVVTLIGSDEENGCRAEVTADEVAAWAETIPYEVTTRIPPRVPRVYSG